MEKRGVDGLRVEAEAIRDAAERGGLEKGHGGTEGSPQQPFKQCLRGASNTTGEEMKAAEDKDGGGEAEYQVPFHVEVGVFHR